MRYYVDTNIWIDFWEDRSDGLRPLGEFAFQFFNSVMEHKDTVCYSNLVVNELKKKFSEELIEKQLFRPLRKAGVLEEVGVSREQMSEARKIASKKNVPVGDALHAILSRDNNAVLVSRDAHCDMLQDIVEVHKPEEVH
ncbi:MAG: PIN domain-containing protein [Candidatus Altiarchaeota archaeon]|nr:PIN domain-containing protein [Candidatus Altiarchaeota archaeon]